MAPLEAQSLYHHAVRSEDSLYDGEEIARARALARVPAPDYSLEPVQEVVQEVVHGMAILVLKQVL